MYYKNRFSNCGRVSIFLSVLFSDAQGALLQEIPCETKLYTSVNQNEPTKHIITNIEKKREKKREKKNKKIVIIIIIFV